MQPLSITQQPAGGVPTAAGVTANPTAPVAGEPTRELPPLPGVATATPGVAATSVAPSVTAGPALPTIAIVPPISGTGAWEAIKQNYVAFDQLQVYALPGNTLLWWYDPVTAQFVPLGWVSDIVAAEGQFRVRWQNVDALLVPFAISGNYGLTLDPSVVERIRRAGYAGDTIETFIYLAPDIVAQ